MLSEGCLKHTIQFLRDFFIQQHLIIDSSELHPAE